MNKISIHSAIIVFYVAFKMQNWVPKRLKNSIHNSHNSLLIKGHVLSEAHTFVIPTSMIKPIAHNLGLKLLQYMKKAVDLPNTLKWEEKMSGRI